METLGWQGIGGRVELTFASDVLDMAQIAIIEMNTHSMSRGPSYDPTHRPISIALCKETVDAPRPPSSMRKRSPAWREHSQRLGLLGLT